MPNQDPPVHQPFLVKGKKRRVLEFYKRRRLETSGPEGQTLRYKEQSHSQFVTHYRSPEKTRKKKGEIVREKKGSI
jgi:hypothetical protein